ncbi:MAG: hypothetical protein ACTSR7_19595 [Promethearchaeota archaeon]
MENNSFPSVVHKKLESKYFDTFYNLVPYVMYFIIGLFAIIALMMFSYSVQVQIYVYLGLLALVAIALFFYYIHTIKAKRKRTREKLENVLVNNLTLTNNQRKEIFHEILENYEYLGGNWLKGNLYIIIGVSGGIALALIIYTIMLG